MSEKKKSGGPIPIIVGLVLFSAGLYSVFMVDWSSEPPPEPVVIRPVKSEIVGMGVSETSVTFPGRVKAAQAVDLAFDVSGQLSELAAEEGMKVKKGDVLAKLDDADFRNDLAVAQAESQRAKAQFERVSKAAETDAVSQQEVSNAQAAYDAARAHVNIKQKAVQNTELRATFDGVIGNTFVDNFETVQAKARILSLQDISSIEVEVNVPERRIIQGQQGNRSSTKLFVVFDYLPDERFPAELIKIAADADPATQTYQATVALPQPDTVNILPGMSALVVAELAEERNAKADVILVPVESLGIDPAGAYYVWKLDGEGDTYKVSRVDVAQGAMSDFGMEILSGLNAGDRIATAGVNFLKDGQQVKLLAPSN